MNMGESTRKGVFFVVVFQMKQALSSPPVLSHYSPDLPTKVSADASSSYGMEAVLLQQMDNWRPIFYASRSMTSTEQRYAQVEKESLACTWACEKFSAMPKLILSQSIRCLLFLSGLLLCLFSQHVQHSNSHSIH